MKLKFYINRENKKIPFGCAGFSSSSRWFLLRELYPLTSFKEESAAKQGFKCVRVKREKKLICTTAIIYTPTIFPETRPKTKNPKAIPETAVLSTETVSAVL